MSADTAAGPARSAAAGWWVRAPGVAVLIGLAWFAYAPALSGGWVWDDQAEIIGNKLIRDPQGLAAIWRGTFTPDYFPLKTSLQWLQWRFWGDNPFPYHVTNLVLHLASALLFWRLLRKLGAPGLAAWFGAALFAVHPLAVESVAWIAEFKNAVSLPPLLLAVLAYVDFANAGGRAAYVRSLAWFVVAALCKTSVVMLPAVLLLYSWWRDDSLTRRSLRATAPFFIVSLVLGVVTIWFQHARAMGTWDIAPGGPLERVGRAGAAIVFYLAKSLLPIGLLPVYPRSVPSDVPLAQIAAWVALLAALGWCWRCRNGWGRPALLGFGWFALHLVPVLGLVSMAYLHFAWVADHFAYLPLLGVIGLIAAAGMSIARRGTAARGAVGVGAVVVLALAVAGTRWHAALFAGEETLWRHTLARNPTAWVGHNNLAVVLARQGELSEAVEHLRQALALKPDYADAQVNAASYLAQLGRFDEALAAAVRADAQGAAGADMYSNIGAALLRAGRVSEALMWYERGLRIDPENAKLHKDAGVALYLAGRPEAAVEHYERGLRTEPEPQGHTNCGVALAALDRLPEAIRHYEAALRMAPDSVDAHYNLGIALARAGRPAEARGHFETVTRLNPAHAEAHFHLGELLLGESRAADAAEAYRTAVRLRPNFPEAAQRLEQVRTATGGAP